MKIHSIKSGIIVKDSDASILSEKATHVELQNEAAGCFVLVHQPGNPESEYGIEIEQDEWPKLREAIDEMIEIAKSENMKGEK